MTEQVLIYNRYPLDSLFHLKSKFDGQIDGMIALGLDPVLVCFDKKNFFVRQKKELIKIGKAHTWLPLYNHLFYYIESGLIMAKYIKKHPEIRNIYYRSSPGFYSLYKFAKNAHQNGARLIVEIPSYYADKSKGEKDLSIFRTAYRGIWDYWQKKIDNYVTLFALIGDKNESGMYRGKPSVDISNAINVDSIPLRIPRNDSKIHILALGTMGNWHGFDRIIKAAAQYRGNLDYVIHFVGNNAGGCLEDWKQLADELEITSKIVFHGPLYGNDLDNMFNRCDIGISSLGAYRIGVKSLASLKLREYAARGMPFVYSADDSSIDNAYECIRFSLKVPNNDSIPNMEEILSFAARTKKDIGLPSYEREYARNNMQWAEQFKIIIDKLSTIKE